MPLGELIRKLRQGQLKDFTGKKICTYCSGGYRGNLAADELNNHGFDAVTIDGGYLAWKDKTIEKKWNILIAEYIYYQLNYFYAL